MSLRLIIGRANSGKSTLIYDEITRLVQMEPDGPPLWLLVPEQATFQAEQALCARLGGIMRVRVVSFQRLAHIVMNHIAGAALTPISDLGRRILVRKIIEAKRRELKLFAKAATHPGFADKLVELISELKRYRVSPEQLSDLLVSETASSLSPNLRGKLHDLSIIYETMVTQYSGVAFDSEDCLEWLTEHVPSFLSLGETEIWCDGFTGFSPQEYGTIERLLRMSDVHMCITLDPLFLNEQLSEGHPFFSPWETAVNLRSLAVQVGTSVSVQVLSRAGTEARSAALSHLEQCYFQRSSQPFTGDVSGLVVTGAATRRAEVELAARNIVHLCREHGYRYRELCLIVRDASLYESTIKTIFSAFDIPVFVDKKREVRHHPLLDLVRASLDAVLQDFPYEHMMRCIKSDLFTLTRDEVDFLDNFLLATGVRGRRWFDNSAWRLPNSLASGRQDAEKLAFLINDARKKVASHFEKFVCSLNAAINIREYTQALYSFLDELQVPEQLQAWAEEAAADGDLDTAGLHLQVFDAVSQLLQEVEATLGEEAMPLNEYARILDAGLDGIKLGLIPPGLDQVIVSELGRSRNPYVRGVFVLGANEGVMPAKSHGEGLLSDDERLLLSSLNVGLGPTARRQLFEEDYLIYTGLTRAQEYLCISYAISDDNRAPLAPSLLIKRVSEMFPALKVTEADEEPDNSPETALLYLQHRHSALGYLSAQLRRARDGQEISSVWWDAYSSLLQQPLSSGQVSTAVRGLFHRLKLEPLSRQVVQRLYGRTMRGSVSRLERYSACPFSYFAAYGLKLRERPVYRLAAVDLGNFFHEALDRFVDTLHQQKLDWAKLNREQYSEIAEKVVEAIVPKLDSDILQSSARYRHLTRRLKQVVERSARILGLHAERGKFRPIGVEVGFGGANDRLPALKIELTDGTVLEMVGRIDRIDTAINEDKLYLRVIDYKSGHSKLTPLEVYYGLKIQLLTYLEVALVNALSLVGAEAIPAGALYFRLHDPLLTVEGPVDLATSEGLSLKEFKHSGMVLAEAEAVGLMEQGLSGWSQILPLMAKTDGTYSGDSAWSREKLELMLEHVRALYKRTGEAISSGIIDIAPYRLAKTTACAHCDYAPVCQFDVSLPDGKYRELNKMSSEEVWAAVCSGEGKE